MSEGDGHMGEWADYWGGECDHSSSTGVDGADLNDPTKLWRCDGCGFLYRSVPAGDGTHRTVAYSDESAP